MPKHIPNSALMAVDGVFKCPECQSETKTKQAMASHRYNAHGVTGEFAKKAAKQRIARQASRGKAAWGSTLNRTTPAQVRRMQRMYAKGTMSRKTIAEKTGFSEATVLKHTKHVLALTTTNHKEIPNNGNSDPASSHALTGIKHEDVTYIFGRIERELEVLGQRLEIPYPVLASGMAEFLRVQARRQVLGVQHRVPDVRG